MADRGSDQSPAEEDLTERINQAYASSAPIVPDEPEARSSRPSSGERFAAVLAASTGKGKAEPVPPAHAPAAPAGSAPAPAAPPSSGATPPPPPPSASSSASSSKKQPPVRRVRKARLRLTHVDPWSVMKTSFLLSIALGIVTVVAVAVVWSVLGAAGVWESIDKAVNDVIGETSSQFRIETYLGMNRVMGFTMIVAVIDVVLITVIATLGAFLYNLAAALLGGLEVVLAEEDR
jgi:hypothetical protein